MSNKKKCAKLNVCKCGQTWGFIVSVSRCSAVALTHGSLLCVWETGRRYKPLSNSTPRLLCWAQHCLDHISMFWSQGLLPCFLVSLNRFIQDDWLQGCICQMFEYWATHPWPMTSRRIFIRYPPPAHVLIKNSTREFPNQADFFFFIILFASAWMNDALFGFNIGTRWPIVKARLCWHQSWWLHTERASGWLRQHLDRVWHTWKLFYFPPVACDFPNMMYLGSMRAPIYQRYSTEKARVSAFHLSPPSVCLQMSEMRGPATAGHLSKPIKHPNLHATAL